MARQILGTPPQERPSSAQLAASQWIWPLDKIIPHDIFNSIWKGKCEAYFELCGAHMGQYLWKKPREDRRAFIDGSDARIIVGDDEEALLRLWREKRGEVEPKDLSGNLIVQLGVVTEALNRRWYEVNAGQVITDVQRRIQHPILRWMRATLDGRVEASGAVFEAKFMLPWSFSEEAAVAKYMPQLQHNMWA